MKGWQEFNGISFYSVKLDKPIIQAERESTNLQLAWEPPQCAVTVLMRELNTDDFVYRIDYTRNNEEPVRQYLYAVR